MTVRTVVVAVQVCTFVVLAVLFWREGLTRLAVAQACYGIATVFLFSR